MIVNESFRTNRSTYSTFIDNHQLSCTFCPFCFWPICTVQSNLSIIIYEYRRDRGTQGKVSKLVEFICAMLFRAEISVFVCVREG